MIRLKQDDTTTTSRLLVECLENEGVRYIFGIPGEDISGTYVGTEKFENQIHHYTP